MVDRIDAQQRPERSAREWKRLARVRAHETHTRVQARLTRDPRRVRDTILVQVDAHDLAPDQPRQVQRRTTGATPDLQHTRRAVELQFAYEALQLIARQPAVLSDLL